MSSIKKLRTYIKCKQLYKIAAYYKYCAYFNLIWVVVVLVSDRIAAGDADHPVPVQED